MASLLVVSGYVIGSLLGGGFALAGMVLTRYWERQTLRAQRRSAERAELKLAMREYLAALDAAAIELADLPAVPRQSSFDRLLDRAVGRVGVDVIFYILVRMLRRAAHGKRHDELSDRLVAASTHLRLIAPPNVLEVMDEVQKMSDSHRAAEGRWSKEWETRSPRVRVALREALDGESL